MSRCVQGSQRWNRKTQKCVDAYRNTCGKKFRWATEKKRCLASLKDDCDYEKKWLRSMKRKCIKCSSKLRLSRKEYRCSVTTCSTEKIQYDLKRMCLWQKCRVNQSKYAKVDACYAKMSFKCSPRQIWDTDRCVERPLQ